MAYNWLDPDEALAMADRAVDHGVARVCLVASGRGPSERDVGRVAETVRRIKDRHPGVEVCTSLGLLAPERARQLAGAGVDAYNHNLNTSEAHYGAICSTHTFADRRATVACAQEAGLSPCSGAIFGMGESDEDVVEAALALRALDPDSVPVNFLMPFAGTPLAGRFDLTPQRCLRILALFRFFFPDAEVRIAGGRELHLRSLQGLGLHLANSIFLGDYLTSEGQAAEADLRMIADGGFVLEGATPATLPRADGRLLTLRRRGPGTAAPANV
ncbi:MAG TPA: biotin synthase BioB [Acidimicrobiales bacterium]|nr:biotin synthase BioB [Acidimicrobiales bacterium]